MPNSLLNNDAVKYTPCWQRSDVRSSELKSSWLIVLSQILVAFTSHLINVIRCGRKNGFSVIGASRQQQDRGSLVETPDRGQYRGRRGRDRGRGSENSASRLPRGEAVPRGMLEAPHHCYADKFKNPFIIEPMRTKVNHLDFCRF